MLLAHVVQLFGGLGCISTNVGTMFLHFSMAGDVFQLMSLKCGMFIVVSFLLGLWLFTFHKLLSHTVLRLRLHFAHSFNPPLLSSLSYSL